MTDNRTTELREKLTERGVKYQSIGKTLTYWNHDGSDNECDDADFVADERPDGTFTVEGLTPEQAIAATLGSGTLTAEQVMAIAGKHQPDYCSDTHVCFDWQAIADELNATLGEEINGDTSDGYHTFNELYHHRAVLFSVIVRDHRGIAWKSKLHHDGTMYDDMFIVGIDTPWGQASYHYDIDPYWDMFDCEERESAPEWDGHTPDDAIERIGKLATLGSQREKELEQLVRDMYDVAASGEFDVGEESKFSERMAKLGVVDEC